MRAWIVLGLIVFAIIFFAGGAVAQGIILSAFNGGVNAAKAYYTGG